MVSPIAEPRVTSSAKTLQCLRIEACDPRSDNRRRVVDVDREIIVIRRAVAGVSMAIRVALNAYRGVVLRIAGFTEGRFRYEVKLLHRDPDLSVPLAEGEDEAAVEAQWREWVGFLGLPAFLGRTASADHQVNIDGVDLVRRVPAGRRRGDGAVAGRPRFLRRRRAGRPIVAAAAAAYSDPISLSDGPTFDR